MCNKEKRELYESKDGSKTFYWPQFDEYYHSVNGALTESRHVFINAGLKPQIKQYRTLSVLEISLGTGLNALLTFQEAKKQNKKVNYLAIEPYPLLWPEVQQLELPPLLAIDEKLVKKVHEPVWNELISLNKYFSFIKIKTTLQEFKTTKTFDLVYFDAFAPSAQPELWTKQMLNKIFTMMNRGGILTTYSARGQLKRDLKEIGFQVETLPGPPGKREMTRAKKL